MVIDRRIQSIRRIGSIDMLVTKASVAWLRLKRATTYKTSPHSKSTMMLSTTPGSGRQRRWPQWIEMSIKKDKIKVIDRLHFDRQ